MKKYHVVGMMSGTSMDGIDASIVLTNGINLERTDIYINKKYSPKTKLLLNKAIEDPITYQNNKTLHDLVTIEHFDTIKLLLEKTRIKPSLIGFHGQTIFHDSSKKISMQIGNPKLLSELTKTDVVFNFRKNDIENNGEGAPLAPIYHRLIMIDKNFSTPCCIINIGGVSNITYWDKEILVGFDCGPGNGLLDIFVQEKLNIDFDIDGEIASNGKIHQSYLNKFMKNDYFKSMYPKSLDRKFFEKDFNLIKNSDLSIEDKLATLTEITAVSIYRSLKILPRYPKYLLICGGGQHNKYLIKRIKFMIDCSIDIADDINLNGNLIESELIAFLSVRCIRNFPITFPSTTGAIKPICGGELFKYSTAN